jgi:hypothetical protein
MRRNSTAQHSTNSYLSNEREEGEGEPRVPRLAVGTWHHVHLAPDLACVMETRHARLWTHFAGRRSEERTHFAGRRSEERTHFAGRIK